MRNKLSSRELRARRLVFVVAGLWGLTSLVVSAIYDGFTVDFLAFAAVFAFWCLGNFFFSHVADIFLGRAGGEHVAGPKWLSWLWRGTWNPPWLWLAFAVVNASAFTESLIKGLPLTLQLFGMWGVVISTGAVIISLLGKKA